MSCAVESCGRPTRSSKASLCNTHYFRVRRTGQTGGPEIAVKGQPKPDCSIDGCSSPSVARGYCNAHYIRVRVHGDVDYLTPRTGEHNGIWRGEDIGYSAAHDRVRRVQGSASNQSCATCGQAAAHWAYDHADPDERTTPDGHPYSPDIEHYQPLCVPCHKRFDLDVLAGARG